MIEIEYKDESEKQGVIDLQVSKGLILTGDHTLTDRKLLIFSDAAEVAAIEKKEAARKLDRVDRYQTKLLIELIKILIQKGAISAADFPQVMRDKYQEYKDLILKVEG